MAEKRPLRVCDVCGQVDDHPRVQHMFGANAPAVSRGIISKIAGNRDLNEEVKARALDELLDTTSALRHHDCCAAAGCPDGVCGVILEAAGGVGKTGEALLKLLQANGAKTQKAAADKAVADSREA